MDYNSYVHQNQNVGQGTQDQDQYFVIHSGGVGLSEDSLAVLSTASDDAVTNQIQSNQGDLSHLPILTYSGEEYVMYVKEEVKEEEEEEEAKEAETGERDEDRDGDDHEDINDILRNVMQVPSLQSLSPTPSEGESPSSMTQRRPLAEKQSHNATAPSFAIRSNPKLTIRASLPPGFKYKFHKRKKDYVSGVISRRVIDKGQCFGPYNGSLIDEKMAQDIGSTWELCLRGVVWYYLDGRNISHNNWLSHISPARTTAEQNLEAFQHYGDIYYRAIDNIQPDTELKVFYSDEYREKIGCKVKLDDLNYQRGTDDFQCMECNARCKTSKTMLRHIKFNHEQQEGATNRQETSGRQSAWGTTSASDQLLHFAREALSKSDAAQTSSESAASEKDVFREDRSMQKDRLLTGGHLNQSIMHSSRCGREGDARKHSMIYSSKDSAMVKKDAASSRPDTSVGPSLECPTCGKSFQNEGMLASHQLFHRTTIKEFICEVCSKVSKTFQAHVRHRNSHAEHLHHCFLCESKYRYVSSFYRHLRNGHRIKKLREKYFCLLCKETLPNKTVMIAHRTECAPRKRYVDKEEYQWRREEAEAERRSEAMKSHRQGTQGSTNYYAKEVASDEEDFGDHEPYHSGEDNGSWIGEVEEQRSEEEMGLSSVDSTSSIKEIDDADLHLRHHQEDSDKLGKMLDYYDRPRPFRCKYDSCPRRYVTSHDLYTHIRNVHRPQTKKKLDLRPYKCDQCPRTFASLKGFNNHKVDHTGAKLFKCEPCSKWFHTEERLYRHNHRIHKNRAKTHECKVCGKKFLEGFALKKHEQRHRGERNFACDICERTFTSKHCLQTHMVKHTGEKPFACEVCGKRFSLNLSLVRHAATHDSLDGANNIGDRSFM
ncbi:zinc finger protein 91-like [Lytechinus pictus]|uniref:zinc finger protein 91-like n=1 Tax=Lytechinus pictus TaxID=7653 RepID=UPI0030B9C9B5